jgi:hypothetical protein
MISGMQAAAITTPTTSQSNVWQHVNISCLGMKKQQLLCSK